MKNPFYRLFNFVGAPLVRYRWRSQDFGDLQDNGLGALIQGFQEAAYNGAVLRGLSLSSATGLNFTVASGFAAGPSGDLYYISVPTVGSIPAPTGTAGSRSLVVIRPLVSTPASGIITPPTTPLVTAPLFFDHYAQIVTLDGNGLGGALPATGANDVILFGVRLAAGATGFTPAQAEYCDRDYPGKRGGDLVSSTYLWDTRLQPYNAGANLVGVKSSQTRRGQVTYTGYNVNPTSSFPRSGGLYNGDSGSDTFLNFTSGAITGADTTTSAFTPTIPTANNFIWAVISIGPSDTLQVAYGTQGTYLQCLAAYKSNVNTGAGSVPTTSQYRIAYVLLGSNNGTAITELDVYDSRSQSPNQTQTSETDTTLGNNVAAASDVTGASFSSAAFRSFILEYDLKRQSSTSELRSVGKMIGAYYSVANQWILQTQEYDGDDCGVTFTLTTAGQLKFVSSNLGGTGYSDAFRFRTRTINA